MLGIITNAGYLEVKMSGWCGMSEYNKKWQLNWYPDYIYSGNPWGGLLTNYHDYDSSLPSYVVRLLEGKLETNSEYPSDILFKLNESHHVNEMISRGMTRDKFMAWFKKNVGSQDTLRELMMGPMREPKMRHYYIDGLLNRGGFPYVYVDLKEWLDRCR